MGISPLLAVKDLCIYFSTYEGAAKVVDGVNFEVYKGERVGLVGETGCGKSVTMHAITRLLPIPPAKIVRGEVLFEGRDILKMRDKQFQKFKRNRISMIFQDPLSSLNPVFTIGEQLMDVIKFSVARSSCWIWPSVPRKALRSRALSILEEVQLHNPARVLNSYPFQLSGGMMQRVLIAMALVAEPSLLIADEPGTALDVTVQAQILRLLRELVQRRKTSILLISHNLGVIRENVDRVYIMYAGRIVEEAQTQELFRNPMHPYTKGLLASVPRLTGGVGEGIEGRIPSYTDPPGGCRFHPRCKHVIEMCRKSRPPMVEVGEQHRVSCFLYVGD